MKISEVISKVNMLYPHAYDADTELMVSWCNEVTAVIKNRITPEFKSCVQTYVGKLALPDGVSYGDVEKVYVNGVLLDRLDERTLGSSSLILGDRVKVVYKKKPVFASTDETSESYYENVDTACRFPHDMMYVDFLCSQIAFYQNDLADYNKFISSYNQRLAEFEKEAVGKLPKQPEDRFKNLW